MKHKYQNIIEFGGLKEGSHLFEFNIDDHFLNIYTDAEISSGLVKAEVQLIKKPRLLELSFSITGHVLLACDRCLGSYSQDINSEYRLFVRFGEISREETHEMIIIPEGESKIDVSQYIYEYIMLSLPYKRIHPENENGDSLCDNEMIKRINNLNDNKITNNDPRWDKLRNLVNKN